MKVVYVLVASQLQGLIPYGFTLTKVVLCPDRGSHVFWTHTPRSLSPLLLYCHGKAPRPRQLKKRMHLAGSSWSQNVCVYDRHGGSMKQAGSHGTWAVAESSHLIWKKAAEREQATWERCGLWNPPILFPGLTSLNKSTLPNASQTGPPTLDQAFKCMSLLGLLSLKPLLFYKPYLVLGNAAELIAYSNKLSQATYPSKNHDSALSRFLLETRVSHERGRWSPSLLTPTFAEPSFVLEGKSLWFVESRELSTLIHKL